MNPFEQFANAHTTSRRPSRVRVVTSEAAAPMVPNAMEKEQRDQSRQFALYMRAKRGQHKALLAGPYGDKYRALLALLKTFTPQSARALALYVKHARWIKRCSDDERATILSVINMKIMRHREEQGLAPMSDPLPGEPANLFLMIRSELMGV